MTTGTEICGGTLWDILKDIPECAKNQYLRGVIWTDGRKWGDAIVTVESPAFPLLPDVYHERAVAIY